MKVSIRLQLLAAALLVGCAGEPTVSPDPPATELNWSVVTRSRTHRSDVPNSARGIPDIAWWQNFDAHHLLHLVGDEWVEGVSIPVGPGDMIKDKNGTIWAAHSSGVRRLEADGTWTNTGGGTGHLLETRFGLMLNTGSRLLVFNGSEWTVALNSVSQCVSDVQGNVYVGRRDELVILGDDTAFIPAPYSYFRVQVVDSSRVYVYAGESEVFALADTGWVHIPVPTPVEDMCVSATRAWYRDWDGQVWALGDTTAPHTVLPFSISHGGFKVDDDGTILVAGIGLRQFRGGIWENVLPGIPSLRQVHVFEDNTVLVNSGTAIALVDEDQQFEVLPLPPSTEQFESLQFAGRRTDEIYAVDQYSGLTIKWDGTDWSSLPSFAGGYIRDMHLDSNGELLVIAGFQVWRLTDGGYEVVYASDDFLHTLNVNFQGDVYVTRDEGVIIGADGDWVETPTTPVSAWMANGVGTSTVVVVSSSEAYRIVDNEWHLVSLPNGASYWKWILPSRNGPILLSNDGAVIPSGRQSTVYRDEITRIIHNLRNTGNGVVWGLYGDSVYRLVLD